MRGVPVGEPDGMVGTRSLPDEAISLLSGSIRECMRRLVLLFAGALRCLVVPPRSSSRRAKFSSEAAVGTIAAGASVISSAAAARDGSCAKRVVTVAGCRTRVSVCPSLLFAFCWLVASTFASSSDCCNITKEGVLVKCIGCSNTTLDLSGRNLVAVAPDAFVSLGSGLELIKLAHNNLSRIENGTFWRRGTLKFGLDLSFNRISSVDEGAFSPELRNGPLSLKELNLVGNCLYDLSLDQPWLRDPRFYVYGPPWIREVCSETGGLGVGCKFEGYNQSASCTYDVCRSYNCSNSCCTTNCSVAPLECSASIVPGPTLHVVTDLQDFRSWWAAAGAAGAALLFLVTNGCKVPCFGGRMVIVTGTKNAAVLAQSHSTAGAHSSADVATSPFLSVPQDAVSAQHPAEHGHGGVQRSTTCSSFVVLGCVILSFALLELASWENYQRQHEYVTDLSHNATMSAAVTVVHRFLSSNVLVTHVNEFQNVDDVGILFLAAQREAFPDAFQVYAYYQTQNNYGIAKSTIVPASSKNTWSFYLVGGDAEANYTISEVNGSMTKRTSWKNGTMAEPDCNIPLSGQKMLISQASQNIYVVYNQHAANGTYLPPMWVHLADKSSFVYTDAVTGFRAITAVNYFNLSGYSSIRGHNISITGLILADFRLDELERGLQQVPGISSQTGETSVAIVDDFGMLVVPNPESNLQQCQRACGSSSNITLAEWAARVKPCQNGVYIQPADDSSAVAKETSNFPFMTVSGDILNMTWVIAVQLRSDRITYNVLWGEMELSAAAFVVILFMWLPWWYGEKNKHIWRVAWIVACFAGAAIICFEWSVKGGNDLGSFASHLPNTTSVATQNGATAFQRWVGRTTTIIGHAVERGMLPIACETQMYTLSYLAAYLAGNVASGSNNFSYSVFVADPNSGFFVEVTRGNDTLRGQVCCTFTANLSLYNISWSTKAAFPKPYRVDTDGFVIDARPWFGNSTSSRSLSYTAPYAFFSASGSTGTKFGTTATISVLRAGSKKPIIVGVDIALQELSNSLPGLDSAPPLENLIFLTNLRDLPTAALLAANDGSALKLEGPGDTRMLVLPENAVNGSSPSKVAAAARAIVTVLGSASTGCHLPRVCTNTSVAFGEQIWVLWVVTDLTPILQEFKEYESVIFVGAGILLACIAFYTSAQEKVATPQRHRRSSSAVAGHHKQHGACEYCSKLALITGPLHAPLHVVDVLRGDNDDEGSAAIAYADLCRNFPEFLTASALRELYVEDSSSSEARSEPLVRRDAWLALQRAVLGNEENSCTARPPLDIMRMVLHWTKSGSSAALFATVIAYRMIRARATAAAVNRAVRACWILHSRLWRGFIFSVSVLHSVLAYTNECPSGASASDGWIFFYTASWLCIGVQVVHVLLARFVERCGPPLGRGHDSVVGEASDNCTFSHETLWTTLVERRMRRAQVALIAANAVDLIVAALYAPYHDNYRHAFLGASRPIMLYLVSYRVRASFAQCFKAIVNARSIFLVAMSLVVVSGFGLLTLTEHEEASSSDASGINFESSGSRLLDSFLRTFVFLFTGENFFELAVTARGVTSSSCTFGSECEFAVFQEALLVFAGFAGARLPINAYVMRVTVIQLFSF